MDNLQGDLTPPTISIAKSPKSIKRRRRTKTAQQNYSAIVGLLNQQHEYELLSEIELCGRAVGRRMKYRRVPNGAAYRGAEWFCRSRHCPLCTQASAAAWGREMCTITDKVLTESPTTEFLLATFKTGREVIITSEESALEIATELCLLSKAVSRLVKRKELRQDFLGSVRVIEIALNPLTLGAWVHLHCVIAIKPTYFKPGHYLNRESWRRLWATALKIEGLEPEVWLKRLKRQSGEPKEQISKTIARWVQYGLKASWLNAVPKIPESQSAVMALKAILKSLRGKRFISLTGLFRKPARTPK